MMKNKMIGLISLAIVALLSGYCVYESQAKVKLSELALNNIEALAYGNETGNTRGCFTSWRKASNNDDLGIWEWVCQDCEPYWLLEASNKSTCNK